MSLSNVSNVEPTTGGSLQGLITYETLIEILFVFYYILGPPILFYGCVSNIINMVVFVKVGIQESVTLSFFVLSTSDCAYSFTFFAENIWDCLGVAGMREPISAYSLSGYMNWYKSIFLDISMLTTVYIAVVRCCCVVLPFTFKSSFTVRRTTIVLATVTLASVALRIPHLSSSGLSWQTNPVTNTSRLTFWFSDNFSTINTVVLLIDRTILPMSVLSIVSVCSIILTRALVRASNVRQGLTGGQDHSKNSYGPMKLPSGEDKNIAEDENKNGKTRKHKTSAEGNSGQLSEKDVRLVKAVVLVTIFLLISTFVMSVNGLAVAFVPEYFAGRRYFALYNVLYNIEHGFNCFNASVNTVIYLKFNTKFRNIFKEMFLRIRSKHV